MGFIEDIAKLMFGNSNKLKPNHTKKRPYKKPYKKDDRFIFPREEYKKYHQKKNEENKKLEAFKKGEEFENYVENNLFPEKYFILVTDLLQRLKSLGSLVGFNPTRVAKPTTPISVWEIQGYLLNFQPLPAVEFSLTLPIRTWTGSIIHHETSNIYILLLTNYNVRLSSND